MCWSRTEYGSYSHHVHFYENKHLRDQVIKSPTRRDEWRKKQKVSFSCRSTFQVRLALAKFLKQQHSFCCFKITRVSLLRSSAQYTSISKAKHFIWRVSWPHHRNLSLQNILYNFAQLSHLLSPYPFCWFWQKLISWELWADNHLCLIHSPSLPIYDITCHFSPWTEGSFL